MDGEYFLCPRCGHSYRSTHGNSRLEVEWLTGYEEGQFFTDGFSQASDYQLFTKCEGCKTFFWREEAVPEKNYGGTLPTVDAMLKAAAREKKPGRSHLPSLFFERSHRELLKEPLSRENELYVRKKIWWEINCEFRSRGFVESYPQMKRTVMKSFNARLEYYLKTLFMVPASIPYKYGRLMAEDGSDPKWTLNAWVSFMCDKVYITLDEDFAGSEEYDSRDFYPGKPTANDVLFFEQTRKTWERGEMKARKKNLEAMLRLLNAETASNGLLKAEIYRCLGKFGECISLLKQLPASAVGSKIRVEAQQRNRNVIRDAFGQYG